VVDRKYSVKIFFDKIYFSNICFGEDPPAPNTAASLPKTQVAPPVSAGPADVNTTSSVKTTASSTSTDAFEDSGGDQQQCL